MSNLVITGNPLTEDLFITSNLSTARVFDELHKENVKYRDNIRGEINKRYNQLLTEAKKGTEIQAEKIPGKSAEELGMDKTTLLVEDLYWRAYAEVILPYQISSLRSRCKVVQDWSYQTLPHDVFPLITGSLNLPDILRCEEVCKDWNAHMNTSVNKQSIWGPCSIREGIPLVESCKEQDYKFEFKTLAPIIIGARQLGFLGKAVGEIPRMHRKIFSKLFEADSFEKGKLMKETFSLFVNFKAFCREASYKTFPFFLKNGELQKCDNPEQCIEQELEIPNTLKNVWFLCQYPLVKGKKSPAFKCADDILNKFRTCQNSVELIFMRKQMPSDSYRKDFFEQTKFVQEKGSFNLTSLVPRVIYNAFCAVEFGKIPDALGMTRAVRTSDFALGHSLVIGQLPGDAGGAGHGFNGMFAGGRISSDLIVGLDTQVMSKKPDEYTGVIPCLSAEVSELSTSNEND